MVGAGTVREERYGRMTKNDELRQKRMNEGLVGDALAVVVSGRLDLPPDLPLLNEPEQRVVIATASDGEVPGRDRRRRVRPHRRRPAAAPGLPPRGARRALGAVRGRPDAELIPVRGGRRGRALPHPEPRRSWAARAPSRSSPDASWWSPPSPSCLASPSTTESCSRAWRFLARIVQKFLHLSRNQGPRPLVIRADGSSEDRARGGGPQAAPGRPGRRVQGRHEGLRRGLGGRAVGQHADRPRGVRVPRRARPAAASPPACGCS